MAAKHSSASESNVLMVLSHFFIRLLSSISNLDIFADSLIRLLIIGNLIHTAIYVPSVKIIR